MSYRSHEESILYFNGIEGDTGNYLLPPCPPDALAPLLARWHDPGTPRRVAHGIDPDDLEQAGWGVSGGGAYG